MLRKEKRNLDLPRSDDHRQLLSYTDQIVAKTAVILGRVPVGGKPEVKLLHKQADDHAHLLHRKIFADAVSGPEGERYECVEIVNEGFVAGVLAFARSNEPPVGEENRRRREVAWVAVYRPKVNDYLGIWRDIATRGAI